MFIFFTNLDLFCIDNARVIYRKIGYFESTVSLSIREEVIFRGKAHVD